VLGGKYNDCARDVRVKNSRHVVRNRFIRICFDGKILKKFNRIKKIPLHGLKRYYVNVVQLFYDHILFTVDVFIQLCTIVAEDKIIVKCIIVILVDSFIVAELSHFQLVLFKDKLLQ